MYIAKTLLVSLSPCPFVSSVALLLWILRHGQSREAKAIPMQPAGITQLVTVSAE
jgi:hypothetical protein